MVFRMGAPDYVSAVRAQIRAERAAAGLTQEELGRRAGMSKMTIRRHEGADPSRATAPDVEQLAALCEAFGIKVSTLLARAEQRLVRVDVAFSGDGVEVNADLPGPTRPSPGPHTRHAHTEQV